MNNRGLRIQLRIVLLVCYAANLFAQTDKKITLSFKPVYGNFPLQLNTGVYNPETNDSIRIETLKFYISGIEFMNGDKTAWKEESSFHLIDASDAKSLSVSLTVPATSTFNKLRFSIGIDSVTNVSGVMGDDLDPTKGMYWTWQSGYINFKLEGKSGACKTARNEFQLHLGGYQYPFGTCRTVILKTGKEEKQTIVVDIEKLLATIDFQNQHHIMSPGKEAVLISNQLPGLFHLSGE